MKQALLDKALSLDVKKDDDAPVEPTEPTEVCLRLYKPFVSFFSFGSFGKEPPKKLPRILRAKTLIMGEEGQDEGAEAEEEEAPENDGEVEPEASK